MKNNKTNADQILRVGNLAIYRTKNVFEVMVIRYRKKSKTINGKPLHTANTEYLPSPSHWGKFAWSFINLDNAYKKFYSPELAKYRDII